MGLERLANNTVKSCSCADLYFLYNFEFPTNRNEFQLFLVYSNIFAIELINDFYVANYENKGCPGLIEIV